MCRIAHVCCTVHIRHSGRRRVGRQKKIKNKIFLLFFELCFFFNESLYYFNQMYNQEIFHLYDELTCLCIVIARQSKFNMTLFILSPYQSYSLLDYGSPT